MRDYLLQLITDGHLRREGCTESLAIALALNDLAKFERENPCPRCRMVDRAESRNLCPDPVSIQNTDH